MLPPSLPGVAAALSVTFALDDKRLYPYAVVRESAPFALRFEIGTLMTRPVRCPIVLPTPGHFVATTLPIYELEYTLTDEYGDDFFTDHVDLYGLEAPGTLEVRPGLEIPAGMERFTVSAVLKYKHGWFGNECQLVSYTDATTSAELKQPVVSISTSRFSEYRSGFVRRHMVASGRCLSYVYLKEYEPGKDRKELLFHSRTSRARGDRTRVYVPWLRECTAGSCGPSVADGSDAIYGGDENPLLRGGLAMAAFSRQAAHAFANGTLTPEERASRVTASLRPALALFEYVERSEWRPPDGTPSGFFLRSDHAGKRTDGRHYFPASTDELAGMVLGLSYLESALFLSERIDTEIPFSVRQRVIALADRLGNQLKNAHYVIIPPMFDGIELHKGAVGTYVYQRYLSAALRAITGNGYRPPDPQWMGSLHFPTLDVERDFDDHQYAALVGMILANLTPCDRAKLAIQGTAIALPHMKRFNFPMLLHLFLAGTRDPQWDPDKVDELMDQLALLIFGVLDDGGVWGRAPALDTVFSLFAQSIFLDTVSLHDLFDAILPNMPVSMGTHAKELDYYAAAVARLYNLPDRLPSWFRVLNGVRTDWTERYNEEIEATLDAMSNDAFPITLPAGERKPCDYHYINHNPEGRIGMAFVWERKPDVKHRTQGGGKDDPTGLTNSEVKRLYDRGYDMVKEGAGIGYLLPSVLLGGPELNFQHDPADIPLLGACSSLPRTSAQIDLYGRTGAGDEPCDFRFPRIAPDSFDSRVCVFRRSTDNLRPGRVGTDFAIGEPCSNDGDCEGGWSCEVVEERRNDRYDSAATLSWGDYPDLSIDKDTHHFYVGTYYAGFQPKFREAPQPETTIEIEGDRDYFRMDTPDQEPVRVTLRYAVDGDVMREKRLFLDEQRVCGSDGCSPPPCAASPPCERTVTTVVNGRLRHTILVTGGIGPYSLSIEHAPTARP